MISFCHIGNEKMASYRYRCQMPARELGAEINNPNADVLVFSKPDKQDVDWMKKARKEGRTCIVDVCDMHFELDHYRWMVKNADGVVCPTNWFSDYLKDEFGIEPFVIGDPYEFAESLPHCFGDKLLWFGHGTNYASLVRTLPSIEGHPLSVVSNIDGTIPWSKENLCRELLNADIVIIPETAPYKSANRTIESIRQGCFVVAEPHPAINDFPIYIGNIRKGIEWAQSNQSEANQMTLKAQEYVKKLYSPQTLGNAWRTAIQKVQSFSTLEAAAFTGTDG